MSDYDDPQSADDTYECIMSFDPEVNVAELATTDMIRECEKMEDIYPSDMEDMALKCEKEPKKVKMTETKMPLTLQLIVEKKENIHPSPPTSPASSCYQTPKVRYIFWPRRSTKANFMHPASLPPLDLVVTETSGPLVLEQRYSTPTFAFNGTQKRRSRQQIKAMGPEQRKEEVRERDRIHSANLVARKKEKLAGLEESLKAKKNQLNLLTARNFALTIKMNIDEKAQLIRTKINGNISRKHQHELKEKKKAVDNLDIVLQNIEAKEVFPDVKKTTLASRKSRAKQEYRTAKLELDVLQHEVYIEQEALLEVELARIQRQRAFAAACKEPEHANPNGTDIHLQSSFHGTAIPHNGTSVFLKA